MKLTVFFLVLVILTGCTSTKNIEKPAIDELLRQNKHEELIIQLYTYVGELSQWGDELDKLNVYQKQFFLNQVFESEINNGGLNQFFFNSSGNYTNETTESLKAVQAYKTAALLEKAINLFPNAAVQPDRSLRQEQLAFVDETKLNELDKQFYTNEEDLQALNLKFITKYKAKF